MAGSLLAGGGKWVGGGRDDVHRYVAASRMEAADMLIGKLPRSPHRTRMSRQHNWRGSYLSNIHALRVGGPIFEPDGHLTSIMTAIEL